MHWQKMIRIIFLYGSLQDNGISIFAKIASWEERFWEFSSLQRCLSSSILALRYSGIWYNMWSICDVDVWLLWWNVGWLFTKTDLRENCFLNASIAIVRLFDDLSDWLLSKPIKRIDFSVILVLISKFNCSKTSMKASSCPEVGRYAL